MHDQGVGFYLDRTLKRISATYETLFRQQGYDLTIEQWVILHQIHHLGKGCSQREIVQTNYRDRSTISRVIKKLGEKGLVSKEHFPEDKKQFRLLLTGRGRAMVAALLPHVRELRRADHHHIDARDFATFMRVLDRLFENYGT